MTYLPNLPPGNAGQMFQPAEIAGHFDIDDTQWTRPSEWLDLGTSVYGDSTPEKIKGLVAIHPNTEGGNTRNYVAFNFDTSNGSTYTINWGDGTTNTYNSNVTYHYVYDYDAITTDTSTQKATLFRGYKQAVFEVNLGVGVTFDGDGINFNVDGPNVTLASQTTRVGPPILDLFVSTAVTTTIQINRDRPMRMLEQLEVRNTSSNRLLTPQYIYSGAKNLESIPFVPFVYNSGTRDYLRAFKGCHQLRVLPDDFASTEKYWFKNSSRFQETFYRCIALRHLPEGLFGDSAHASCSSWYQMFYDCRNLRYIPYTGVRTTGSTDVRNIFYLCLDLRKVPAGFNLIRCNGITGIVGNMRECYDWSTFDFPDNQNDSPVEGPLDTMTRTATYDATNAFNNIGDSIRQMPYWGSFKLINNATNLFNGGSQLERFHPLYEELGGFQFQNCLDFQQTFYENWNLKEMPTINVRSVTNDNGFYRTFFRCISVDRIKFTGMIDGPNNGEYYQCFYDNYCLQYLEGMDFSHANDSGDYSGLFSQARSLTRINFPGSLRRGNTRLNLTIDGNADISGEYQINEADGSQYVQVGGNGLILRSDFGGTYRWDIYDSSDFSPYIIGVQSADIQYTPWDADWSSASPSVTFSAVETGFKYSVSLRYCPLDRDAMIEIFNNLVSSGSGTIDLRNNSYTSDLTNDDKAIATDKGYTLNL